VKLRGGCVCSYKFAVRLPRQCSVDTAVLPGFSLNVQYLYHGTTAPFEQICDEGLDERLSRSGRFGRGIYFRSRLLQLLWPPYGIGQAIIALWFLSFFFFSSANLGGYRLDV